MQHNNYIHPSSKIFHCRRDPLFIGDEQSIGLEHFYVPAHYQETLDNILVPHGMISDRVEKLAYDITTDYSGNTIHLLCVLKGSRENTMWVMHSLIAVNFCFTGGSTFFHDLCTALKRCHDCTFLNFKGILRVESFFFSFQTLDRPTSRTPLISFGKFVRDFAYMNCQ